jgi:hypothetical protein
LLSIIDKYYFFFSTSFLTRQKKIPGSKICSISCNAYPANPTTFIVRNINNTNGLAGSMVQGIGHDRQGYIWIGTKKGLRRYDGLPFLSCFGADTTLQELFVTECTQMTPMEGCSSPRATTKSCSGFTCGIGRRRCRSAKAHKTASRMKSSAAGACMCSGPTATTFRCMD